MFALNLRAATGNEDFLCIENLMQFYMYDFSEWLPLDFSADGFFSLQPKYEYFTHPSTSPFIVEVDGKIAGFVTVDHDTHIEGATYNIGYFFIGRQYRAKGLARRVVASLLHTFDGGWQIFHINANATAKQFWDRVIPQLVGAAFTRHSIEVDGYECTAFGFASPV